MVFGDPMFRLIEGDEMKVGVGRTALVSDLVAAIVVSCLLFINARVN